jgi:hypothetical protein
MWVISPKEEAVLGPDGKPVHAKLRKGYKPGDYHISEDERSVYSIADDGSLRRIKDKEAMKRVLTRFYELKAAHEKRVAEQRSAAANALTHVDKKTVEQVAALLAVGGALPQPPRMHV